MAGLKFVENSNTHKYVAEVVVNSDFNVHLERVSGGGIEIFQKQGEYTEAVDNRTAVDRGFDSVLLPSNVAYDAGKVFDYDFQAFVYPKTIRIESGSAVTVGTVTES